MAKKIPRRRELSPRQVQVLEFIMNGYADKQIAIELGISYHTIKGHITKIYDRLGAIDRAHAVAIFLGHSKPSGGR